MNTLKRLPSKKVIVICMFLVFQATIHLINGQQTRQMIVNPIMKVSNLNARTESTMKLENLSIDIRVIGQIAVTTLDMTYYNGNQRVMEGEFNFPLGEGQSITRFALDINGSLREGVVVEKEQGRKTFEAIVRRGVDPGLAEMTEGNNFRMRVYPLPAKGTRRIVLAFEQELTDKGNNDLYLLPLKLNDVVSKFSLRAEVIKNQVKLDSENNEMSNLTFNIWNDSYVANFEQDNYIPNKQIALSFPHVSDSAIIFTATNEHSDSSFFYLSIRPKLNFEPKTMPKQLTLLWDNSNSTQNRDKEKEFAILDAYFQKIGNLVVDFVPFNIKIQKSETFNITNGNWDELRNALETTVYDGGTSFGCIDFTKFRGEEVLLFSDGMTNFGTSEPKFSNTPIITINSSLTASHGLLTLLAQKSGGVYINLNKLTNVEALSLLLNKNFHFISAQIEDGKVYEIYPSMPSQFINSFSLTGRMASKTATILLNFGFGTSVTYSKRINLNVENTVNFQLLSRFWSEKKIAELSLDAEKNKNEIILTGKEYGIITQYTSLLVLENLSDYLQFNIVPPQEMQNEYFRLKFLNEQVSIKKSQNHIDSVVSLSNIQSKWWNKVYSNLPPKSVPGSPRSVSGSVRYTAPSVVDSVMVGDEVKEEVESEVFMMVEERNESLDAPSPRRNQTKNDQIKENQSNIQINAWDPQTPYSKVLQYSTSGQEYNTYLKLKKEYYLTPTFYIDAADFFFKLGEKDLALQILSNLSELKLESAQLLRILGNKLLDFNYKAESLLVFQKILEVRGEEPQSYLDLGLAYKANGDFQKSINTLYEVVTRIWSNRFPAIELLAMNEINDIISLNPKLNLSFIDNRLIKKEPVDIRVVLTWDTDNSDMDLWVTDPFGEKCFFQHNLTRLGGKLSNDFTTGYGPEEFMIKKAVQGEYLVQVNYYGTTTQSLIAPVNLHLVFYSDYGRPNQKSQVTTIRLDNKNDIIDVGKFLFKLN